MKYRIIFKFFLIAALFFLSSCKEYFITTRINSNGTIERSISQKDDASKDTGVPESWLNNSGWDIKSVFDSSGEKRHKVTANKKFNSFEELTDETAKPQHGFKPSLDVKVEKHFRFFFTYFTYKETYKAYNIYPKIPMNKIFSADEISKIKEGKDSIWAKKKTDSYGAIILFDVGFDEMQEIFFAEDGTDLAKLIPAEKRIELYKELIPVFSNTQKMKENEEKEEEKKIISKYSNKNVANRIINYFNFAPAGLKRNKVLKAYDDLAEYDAPYENSVIMPGIITSSNSRTIEGNKVSWKFDQEKFKFFDYEMSAESREVNTWVIVVSGIVILLIMTGLLLPKLRRKTAF